MATLNEVQEQANQLGDKERNALVQEQAKQLNDTDRKTLIESLASDSGRVWNLIYALLAFAALVSVGAFVLFINAMAEAAAVFMGIVGTIVGGLIGLFAQPPSGR